MAQVRLFDEKAPGIMRNLIRDLAIGELDAAAILGNIGHECAGFETMQEIRPKVGGSRGGYGWCQWTGPRRRDFESFCADRKWALDSDAANYGFLKQELMTSEKAALAKLRVISNLQHKVEIFELSFLRAGVKNYPSRMAWAARALKAYRETLPAGAAAGGKDQASPASPSLSRPEAVPPARPPVSTTIKPTETIMKALDGYKTYIVIGLFLGCLAVEKLLGADIPGFEAGPDWLNQVLAALGLGGLRSALSKLAI
jgi:hypothetical protein